MINAITEAISIALNGEFGNEYRVYADNVEQGLEEPCFFVSCINPVSTPYPGKRYLRENLFCIQYFPKNRSREKEECSEVAERLFLCLEWLTVEGDPVRGTKMRAETVDGVLNFFVNYNMFVRRQEESQPEMEKFTEKIMLKG